MRIVAKDEWLIEYYVDGGKSPVQQFMASLDAVTFARFQWSLEQLRVRNIQAREPLVRHIEGKLWELRRESQTNIYRLFYFFYKGRRIILLHGFQKKSRKTPGPEIEIALRRLEKFMIREGGD